MLGKQKAAGKRKTKCEMMSRLHQRSHRHESRGAEQGWGQDKEMSFIHRSRQESELTQQQHTHELYVTQAIPCWWIFRLQPILKEIIKQHGHKLCTLAYFILQKIRKSAIPGLKGTNTLNSTIILHQILPSTVYMDLFSHILSKSGNYRKILHLYQYSFWILL